MSDWEFDRQFAAAERRALALPYRDACEQCKCPEPDYYLPDCDCGCHPPDAREIQPEIIDG